MRGGSAQRRTMLLLAGASFALTRGAVAEQHRSSSFGRLRRARERIAQASSPLRVSRDSTPAHSSIPLPPSRIQQAPSGTRRSPISWPRASANTDWRTFGCITTLAPAQPREGEEKVGCRPLSRSRHSLRRRVPAGPADSAGSRPHLPRHVTRATSPVSWSTLRAATRRTDWLESQEISPHGKIAIRALLDCPTATAASRRSPRRSAASPSAHHLTRRRTDSPGGTFPIGPLGNPVIQRGAITYDFMMRVTRSPGYASLRALCHQARDSAL